MKNLCVFICFSLSLVSTGVDFLNFSRGGSDGPTPFTKITPPKKVVIPLKNPFSSFVFFSGKQTVAYTDHQQRLFLYHLVTGEEFFAGRFRGRIFPEADPFGRVLLSDNLRDIKIVNRSYGSYDFKDFRLPTSQQFGFWNSGKLWMIRSFRALSKSKWQLTFFSFTPEQNQISHHKCVVKLEESLGHVELSSHHSAPYFSLFTFDSKRKPSAINTFLVTPRVDNGICPVERQISWQGEFDGSIRTVNLLRKNTELVVLTNGVNHNLYYSSGKKIFSSKLPEGSPFLLNLNSSVLVNLTAKRGIDIYSLETEKYFNINIDTDRFLMAHKEIWVDRTGNYLFLSAPWKGSKLNDRLLYMMSLEKLND